MALYQTGTGLTALVGIGTTDPTSNLHVNGNVLSNNFIGTYYGPIAGSNTISGTVITASSNVNSPTMNTTTANAATLVATTGFYGPHLGSNTISASSIGIGFTATPQNYLSVLSTTAQLTSSVQIAHPIGDWGLVIKRNANDNGSSNFAFLKNRGDASTIITQGDGIGRISWHATTNASGPVIQQLAEINVTNVSFSAGNADGAMIFSTKQTTDAAPVERMRILPSGYVGVGTNNPSALFQVNASVVNPTVPTVHIGDNSNDYGSTYGMVHLVRSGTPGDTKAHLSIIRNGNTGVNFGFYSNTNTFGIWHGLQNTSATTTIAINSSGQVGIGTTNPTRPLVVRRPGAGTSDIAIMIGNNGSGTGLRFQTYDLAADANAYMGLGTDMAGNSYEHSLVFPYGTSNQGRQTIGTWNGTTYSAKMTILGTGNVGINNTGPSFLLDVNGTFRSYGSKIIVQNGQNGGSSRGLYLWTEGDTGWGIYMATCGTASASLAAGTTSGGVLFNSHAMRFRVYNGTDNGFVFEGSNEVTLVSIRGSDGATYIRGATGLGMTPSYRLDVCGRGYLIQSQQSGYGWNRFAGLEADTVRAQFVLQSSYSDLVISSSEYNGNHGSTISFVTFSPAANDYRKFVINQNSWTTDASGTGGYGDRLAFQWQDGAYTNPHSYVSPSDCTLLLYGRGRSVGINNIRTPGYNLHINGNDYATGRRYTSDWWSNYGTAGLYNDSYYNSFYKNDAYYGNWKIDSGNAINGWNGIRFT